MIVPFNKPYVSPHFVKSLDKFIETKKFSGDGEYSRKNESQLSEQVDNFSCLLTSSGSHSLELAIMALKLPKNTEAIIPDFNFPSAASAVMRANLIPIFADVDLQGNMSYENFISCVNDNTKLVILLHYGGGASPDLEKIVSFCTKNDIQVIEDNAHGIFGKYNNKPLGSFGTISISSFHETKNIHCGEGGAIFFSNQELLERAEIIREKGTNRSAFFRGEIDKYNWVDVGSSFLMSELQAYFLNHQLNELPIIQSKRTYLFKNYVSELGFFLKDRLLNSSESGEALEHSGHNFFIICRDEFQQVEFIKYMGSKGISTPFHYQLLSKSPMMAGGLNHSNQISLKLSKSLVRLPLFFELTEIEQLYVIEHVKSFFK